MSTHHVTLTWRRETPGFDYDTYDRTHRWTFGGGESLKASAAPEYKGDAALPNPEEALVAALSSCHMLTFLAIAARKRLVVDDYEDEPVGTLEKGPDGKVWVTKVVLRPRVRFAHGPPPDLAALHHKAHELCFVANSVKTEVVVEPRGA
ncbi:MAG: OsmC family protein [Myxococcota bacterium]